MAFDRIEAAGFILTVLAVMVSCFLTAYNDFPAFQYASHSNPYMVRLTQPIGQEVSKFMWENRGLDLIAQALVLLGAAVGCLVMLRSERGGERLE